MNAVKIKVEQNLIFSFKECFKWYNKKCLHKFDNKLRDKLTDLQWHKIRKHHLKGGPQRVSEHLKIFYRQHTFA